MSKQELSSYAELAEVIEHLPILIRETLRTRKLSLRQAGLEIGTSASKIMRIERGDDFSAKTIVDVLRWLDGPKLDVETPTEYTCGYLRVPETLEYGPSAGAILDEMTSVDSQTLKEN